MSILTRYALATSIVLLLAMFLFSTIATRSVERMVLEEALKDAEVLSETIISTTHHRMLQNDLESVYLMIDEVGRQRGVESIRLFSKDGVVIYSTSKGEIGTGVSKTSEVCAVCHWAKNPLPDAALENRGRRLTGRSGSDALGLARGIYNKPECINAACHEHPADTLLLGVLDVVIPLTQMHAQGETFRYDFVVIASIMLFCLFFLLVLLTHTQIKEPIKRLIGHTREVAQGNLDAPLDPLPAGELKELGHSFEEMTRSLRQAQTEVNLWATTLEARVAQRTDEIRTIQAQLIHSERLASIGELAAGFAHEINNPLTGVMLFTSMLLDNPKLDPSLRDDLETILGETRRCSDIVHRLLEFSRESQLRMEHASVREILEGTLALLEHQALFHNIVVTRNYALHLAETLVDHDQLRQVFMNILLNAGQAMPLGGELTVGLDQDESLGMIQVTIADTGGGICEQDLPRIFDPFFTTKGASGTGLGLSVSFGIIRNHGGTIEVKSQSGEGTTFIIRLPLTPPPPKGEEEQPRRESLPGLTG